MRNFLKPKDPAHLAEVPRELAILPLRSTVVFPLSMLPLTVGIPRSVKLVEDAVEGDSIIGLMASKDPSVEEPAPELLHSTGTVARIIRVIRGNDNTLQVVVQGLERFRVIQWLSSAPYLKGRVEKAHDVVESDLEMEGLVTGLRDLAKEVVHLSPNIPDEAASFLDQITDPRHLAYLVAGNAQIEPAEAQKILDTDSVKEKLRAIITHLSHQKEVLSLGQRIRSEAKEEMEKDQREYFLRQQLKAIQKELGDKDENQSVVSEYREKLDKAGLPEEARKEAERELSRLASMQPQAPEYSMIKTYLDWMVELPWSAVSEDQLDILNARRVLDEDHYDLEEVKDRIIEYLAVRKLLKERGMQVSRDKSTDDKTGRAIGAILCFVGPPGVGKTSLGKSIARALGRKFVRISLGGIRDEAEIRGHRRTYVGALPGRVVQGVKKAGSNNPVFMLDEVDKIGMDFRGDPSSALLEVLDPEQNFSFSDHYLEVPFDLSKVMFIATANLLDPVPPALKDRMEVLELPGYTEEEKVMIARQFIIPKELGEHGLNPDQLGFDDEALKLVVRSYTKEAGVRNMEREIAAICRSVARDVAEGKTEKTCVTADDIHRFLGPIKFYSEIAERTKYSGVATGLAWTSTGGDIIFVEATKMPGKGSLSLTGQLGDVMKESAQAALSYIRSKAQDFHIAEDFFEKQDLHIHVPQGAIPKDGPSAGITMMVALVSLLTDKPVRNDVAMTGEITLRGLVLPIGGVKEKVLAAKRAGIKSVMLPKMNEKDLEEVPETVKENMKFKFIERVDEAIEYCLMHPEEGTTCR